MDKVFIVRNVFFVPKIRLFVLQFLLVLLFANVANGEQRMHALQNISLSDGLSHNGVTGILEDFNGYLWFATFDGLNLYDGYHLHIYKNTLDKEIISSNRIRSIAQDENANIWIGTDTGIDLFEYSAQSFKNLYKKNPLKNWHDPIITKIAFTQSGHTVCLTQYEGILVFDNNYELILEYFPAIYANQNLQFNDFFELDNDRWLFGTNRGLLIFDKISKEIKPVLSGEVNNVKIVKQFDKNTFIIVLRRGIAIIEYTKKAGEYIFSINKTAFSSEEIFALDIDQNNNLWIGTTNYGMFHVDNIDKIINDEPIQKSFFRFEGSTLQTSFLLSNTSSGCWLGTFNDGVFKFSLNPNPFRHIRSEMNLKNGLKSNIIIQIAEINEEKVFIAANKGGEAVFNTRTNNFEKKPFQKAETDFSITGSVLSDSDGDIWFACNNDYKVLKTNGDDKKLREIINRDNGFDLKSIRTIDQDKNGDLWLGGSNGVFRIRRNGISENIGLDNINDHDNLRRNEITMVRFMYVDPDYNILWIGTEYQGLYRIEYGSKETTLQKLKITNYKKNNKGSNSISSNFVTSIVRTPCGDLWVGTEYGGINKVIDSVDEPKFLVYSEKDGLSNNVVKNILYDDHENLWITTNSGLNKFNPKLGLFQTIRKQDGLPFDDFSHAAIRLKNGYMLLGGMKGFCYFKPEDVKMVDDIPPFQFGSIKLHNKVVTVGDTINGRVLIPKRLDELEEITFKHYENVFSLELTSLHFSDPNDYFIRYKLSPISEDWILNPTSQRFVNFSGLQPGEYELEAMASNSINQWGEVKKIKFKIKPPWWKTTWAVLVYFFLLSAFVLTVIMIRFNVMQLKHKLEIEQLEKSRIKEVDEAKFKFFSNISHEFKTPLTLISGPIEMILNRYKGDVELVSNLNLIKRQSRKMSQLVDQVHDFRKSDINTLRLNYSVFEWNDFINELLVDFKSMAKNTGKTFEVKAGGHKIYVRADKDNLEKIINNILNNAFKFTKQGDKIELESFVVDNKLNVRVIDTGMGIEQQDLPHIFERFYQSKKPKETYTGGSGIGLAFSKRLVEMHFGSIHAESKLGEITIFHVELPIIVEKALDDDEIGAIIKKEKISIADKESIKLEQIGKDELKLTGDFSNSLIFLAEDNYDMRFFITQALEKYFNIKEFANGQELLKRMEVEWPDIIISDVLMPDLNGLELCSAVKSDIRTGHIPVILLTACTSTEDQLKGLKTGADLYLKKPFEVQHLVTSIENILQNRKLLRERYMGDFAIGLEKKPENSNDNIFLEKLMNLMAENLDNAEMDISSLARELGLNRTHFYQKVKVLTNETPYELLKSYRLKKAAEYLSQKKLSINEVFVITGFKSRPHFSRAFKAKYGISPGKYASMDDNDKL